MVLVAVSMTGVLRIPSSFPTAKAGQLPPDADCAGTDGPRLACHKGVVLSVFASKAKIVFFWVATYSTFVVRVPPPTSGTITLGINSGFPYSRPSRGRLAILPNWFTFTFVVVSRVSLRLAPVRLLSY